MNSFLEKQLDYVKGIGPARAELLAAEFGLRNVNDLLQHYPYRYVDRSKMHRIADGLRSGEYVQLRGGVAQFTTEGTGNKTRLRGIFSDGSGTVELIWFKGIKWIKEIFLPGKEYVIYGKVSAFKNSITIAHPEIEPVKGGVLPKGYLQPVYSTTEKLNKRGLNSKGIERAIAGVLQYPDFRYEETLPDFIRDDYKLIGKTQAVKLIHKPRNQNDIRHAERRLKFEELFFLQIEILLKKELRVKEFRGFVLENVGSHFNTFYEEKLPFELTGAQKRVMKEIRRDMKSGKQMNRLLQGDVGSGKTIVATLCALLAIDNGFQTTIMAPTEILAKQHFESLSELLSDMGIRVDLLTGSTRTARRREIDETCMDGSLNILIGTHALLEKKVRFKNLGLAVIDEQHRFGVAQRARLWRKNKLPPHILVMTATPIPRTLAMTLYGDLEVSVIDELPPGRKPIQTSHLFDSARLRIFGFMEDQIRRGRQIYVVYPLIEESASLDLKDLMDGYESISRRFPKPKYQISIVHGKMKAKDKDFEMNRFAKGETQIMVATTVIEVGVNVPNATVMVIESAQRFGLSQLHQLRGRVGRGGEQSYCLLVTDPKLSSDARTRMKTMTQTNDGFKIAEVDLKLRGPGDLMGTQQSGILDLKLADLAQDSKILVFARNTALEILEEDPELKMEKHLPVARRAAEIIKNRPNWSLIS